jgi:hypothetical protein
MVKFAKGTVGRKVAAVAAVVGMGSLLAACRPSTLRDISSSPLSSSAPVSFACEPNQRAVMRQVLVNGTPQQQMSCESAGADSSTVSVGTTGSPATGVVAAYPPVSYAPAPYAQAPYARGSYAQAPLDTRTVPATEVVTREVAPERVVYQRVPERRIVTHPRRTIGTSALVIGSSAAGGAGIGALIGGKRGAGIGALAGGGAAALWDQITRRR